MDVVWPPIYRIRRSPRARRTFLQITPAKGLEIVVPDRLKRPNVEKILIEKRSWIEKMLARFQVVFPSSPLHEQSHTKSHFIPLEKPRTLILHALEETWQICYQPSSEKRIMLHIHDTVEKILILKGNTNDISLCLKVLKKWLVQKAHLHLISWLQNLSIETQLIYHRAAIRGQNTLWGSCNAKKNISLNYKLLFLRKPLTEHVLLHELCHLKYLNHSKHFWLLLKSFDRDCAENKKALKLAECYVPGWLGYV